MLMKLRLSGRKRERDATEFSCDVKQRVLAHEYARY